MSTVLEDRPANNESAGGRFSSRIETLTPNALGEEFEKKRYDTRRVDDYEVVFLLDQNKPDQKAFDFAVETARNFSANLSLVYVTPRTVVPSDYLEFAKIEGIRDYEWQYHNSAGTEKLEILGRRANDASIHWTTQVHIGDLKSAIRSFVRDGRKIVVLNRPSRKIGYASKLRRIILGEPAEMSVPVLVS